MINSLLIMLAGVAVGELVVFFFARAIRKKLNRMEERRVTEILCLQDTVVRLQAKIDELEVESRERAAMPIPVGRLRAINLHPRAEALRMLRRGSDENTVAATLNLPLADVALLRKVSVILCAAKEA